MYDEFGHSTIPDFVSTANTIRGYKVPLSIALQSIRQLNARYGNDYAHAIQGGFSTNIAYAGSDPKTSLFFEKIIGRQRITQLPSEMVNQNYNEQYREQNLLNSAEVRTIADDEILIVSKNRQPILTKAIPYFKRRNFTRMTKRGAYPISNTKPDKVEYVQL